MGITVLFLILSCEKPAKKNQVQATQKIAQIVFFDSLKVRNLDITAEVVEDEYHRAKGLMFRESLPENQGMFFIFDDEAPRYFWMKNTTISLDIIYVSADLHIVNIQKNTTPLSEQTYPSEKPAKYVIEVRAGFTDRYQIQTGDTISWNIL